jgi:hypothetical protein
VGRQFRRFSAGLPYFGAPAGQDLHDERTVARAESGSDHRAADDGRRGSLAGSDACLVLEPQGSQLIANAVIYYNTLLLSRVYAQKQAAGDHAAADIVKDISPNAWQHVHLICVLISSRLNRKSTSMRSGRVMMTQTSGVGPWSKCRMTH